MRPLPTELGLLVSILVTSSSALPHVSGRDDNTPCSGDLKPLNTQGQSPGSVYLQLMQHCNTVVNPDASVCRCNLIAYNLNQASSICQQEQPTSWTDWANANQCTNSTAPPNEVPYDTSSITIPKWASTNLASNDTFDLAAALKAAKGWSPLQIVLPIIVGVAVLVIAGIMFFFYRRRKNAGIGSSSHKPRKKAWRNAYLPGPRRFFGLVPDVLKVRSGKTRDAQWEIDDGNNILGVADDDYSPSSQAPFADSRAPSRQDTASMHSRTTSITSLLSSPSYSSGDRSHGFFSSLANKFSSMSLSKKYQSGTTKGPDYKRVQVQPGNADRRFRLDGADALSPTSPVHPRSEPWTLPAPTPAPLPPRRDSAQPSVLDIHAPRSGPSTAIGRPVPTVSSALYDIENMSSVGLASPVVAESDYSLMTSDLLTPVTPSRDAAATTFGQRRQPIVSPGSPFLPSARINVVQPSGNHALRRNQSTDTLAFELYPRQVN